MAAPWFTVTVLAAMLIASLAAVPWITSRSPAVAAPPSNKNPPGTGQPLV